MQGSAISTALGAPLPFEPDDVALMWPFVSHALHQVLVPELAAGLAATFAVEVTDTFSFGIRVSNGALELMSPAPAQADCVVSGDARALFLVLIKILDVEEAIKEGSLRLSGPRPDLGFYLMDLFNIP
ncbi:MAG: SCP2 sterol-binding domain-containing protein, partial [Actinomycetota bacterium]